MLKIDPHPLLLASSFTTTFARPLGEVPTPAAIRSYHDLDARAPVGRSEELRAAVRDLLRHGGHKPTGRGKPSCEYLVRAVGEGKLPSINLAVDACNAVSLHSGLPISVVDLARARPPFRIGIGAPGESYEFNTSGQAIDLEGLLCLYDAEGPCANAVKDAQRTKTDESTTRTLSVIWGTNAFPGQLERATAWYRELLGSAGAATEDAAVPR